LKFIGTKWFFDFISTKGKFFNFCIGLAFMATVCILDIVDHEEYSFSFFYLFPIAFTTWYAGRTAGMAIAVLSATNWAVHNHSHYTHVQIWNAVSTFGVFVTICILVDKVYRMWLKESEQSRSDYLTGLSNSRDFMEKLEYEISRAQREHEPFSLGYVDLDNFKEINDRYGHKKGDELLQSVAKCFTSDLRKTDLIARMGGDEFCIYFPATGHEAVQVVMNKVRQGLLETMKQQNWPTTFSMGVVTCLEPPRNADEIVLYADKIMYIAKNSGKNRINFVSYSDRDEQLPLPADF